MIVGIRVLVLGGSWVVIRGVVSKIAILTTLIKGLITPLMTTHEPPSRGQLGAWLGSAHTFVGFWG